MEGLARTLPADVIHFSQSDLATTIVELHTLKAVGFHPMDLAVASYALFTTSRLRWHIHGSLEFRRD